MTLPRALSALVPNLLMIAAVIGGVSYAHSAAVQAHSLPQDSAPASPHAPRHDPRFDRAGPGSATYGG